MKFTILASAIATLAPLASAAGYQAAWTITGAKCDGQISLGEYTASDDCKAKDCGPIANITDFSTKTTCAESHISAAKEVLGANKKPYVLVEVYKADSNCTGAFDIAIGVTADGKCYPGTNGKASYNVMWTAEKGTVWLQYDDGMCKGKETKVDFAPTAADGKVCTAGFLKALAVAPEANASASSNNETMTPGATTMMPGATTMMPSGTTAGNTSNSNSSTPAPATTKSAASTTIIGAAVASFAIAAAVLA